MLWKHESDVIANGIRLHVRRTGGSNPPLILAHGITDNGRCWSAVAEALKDKVELIAYDARGHGLSEVPRQPPTWQELADDLAALVPALGLTKPGAMGHSMGGATVGLAAAQHPDLFGRVVLVDPAWHVWSDQTPEQLAATRDGFRQGIEERCAMSAAELQALCRRESPTWSEAEIDPWAESKLQVDPSVAELIGGELQEWTSVARAITCPALLVYADVERGGIVGPELAAKADAIWAQGRSLHIPAAGHSIHREQFAAFIQGVREFLV